MIDACSVQNPRFNLMGDTHDLRHAVRHIQAVVARDTPGSPLCLVGISAGSGLLVRCSVGHGAREAVCLCEVSGSMGARVAHGMMAWHGWGWDWGWGWVVPGSILGRRGPRVSVCGCSFTVSGLLHCGCLCAHGTLLCVACSFVVVVVVVVVVIVVVVLVVCVVVVVIVVVWLCGCSGGCGYGCGCVPGATAHVGRYRVGVTLSCCTCRHTHALCVPRPPCLSWCSNLRALSHRCSHSPPHHPHHPPRTPPVTRAFISRWQVPGAALQGVLLAATTRGAALCVVRAAPGDDAGRHTPRFLGRRFSLHAHTHLGSTRLPLSPTAAHHHRGKEDRARARARAARQQ